MRARGVHLGYSFQPDGQRGAEVQNPLFDLLSAVREHRRNGLDPHAATVEALAGTGRTINAAAAVMIGVFASFALAGSLPVKEMGVILAVGVLLDTVFVRLMLQPVLLRLSTTKAPLVRRGHFVTALSRRRGEGELRSGGGEGQLG